MFVVFSNVITEYLIIIFHVHSGAFCTFPVFSHKFLNKNYYVPGPASFLLDDDVLTGFAAQNKVRFQCIIIFMFIFACFAEQSKFCSAFPCGQNTSFCVFDNSLFLWPSWLI